MSYMKFHLSTTPREEFVLARCFSGPSFEDNHYAGTLVLPAADWEHFLDCLIFGAAHIVRDDQKLEVYFAPDSGSG